MSRLRQYAIPVVDDQTLAKQHAKRLEQLDQDNFTIYQEFESLKNSTNSEKTKFGLIEEENEKEYSISILT